MKKAISEVKNNICNIKRDNNFPAKIEKGFLFLFTKTGNVTLKKQKLSG